MKSLVFLCSIAFALATTSCNTPSKDSKELADSINETKDTATTAATIITVNENEAEFATNAADASLAGIGLANLAISKTTNAAIKDNANTILKDYGAANDELVALAKTKNITLPTSMSHENQKRRDELAEKNGTDFDRKYVNLAEEHHVKVLAFMEHQARRGTDPDLTAYANKMLPIIKSHLNAIRKIKDAL